MTLSRRRLLAAASAAIAARFAGAVARAEQEKAPQMYGLIGKMNAVAGQREALLSVMLGSLEPMPGCLSYVVATDPADPDGLWITEVWDSAASHRASLTLPAVQATIARARPLIAGFSNSVETVPVGGLGVPKAPPR